MADAIAHSSARQRHVVEQAKVTLERPDIKKRSKEWERDRFGWVTYQALNRGFVLAPGHIDELEAFVVRVNAPRTREERITDTRERLARGEDIGKLSKGRCAICHRELSDPVSLARGIGPECAALV